MAELRSIEFPGLDGTFQVPQPTVFEKTLEGNQVNHDNILDGLNADPGDLAVLVENEIRYTYVLSTLGKWVPCYGKIDAKNIIFTEGFTVSGDFDNLGNLKNGETISPNTSLDSIVRRIFEKRLPAQITQPSVDVEFIDCPEEVEIGTVLNLRWTAKFNPGKYSYGPETGVEVGQILLYSNDEEYFISGEDGQSELSGIIENIEVTPEFDYYIKGMFNHSRGVYANDSLGTTDVLDKAFIEEGQIPFESKHIKGYYPIKISVDDSEKSYKFEYNKKNIYEIQTNSSSKKLSVAFPEKFGNVFKKANMICNGESFNVKELFTQTEGFEFAGTRYLEFVYSPDFFAGVVYEIEFEEAKE